MFGLSDTGSSRSVPRKRKKLQKAMTSRHGNTAAPRSEGSAQFICRENCGCGCGRAFARKADRDRHERLKSTNWAFVCDDCKGTRKRYIFARKEQLRGHLRNINIHPEQDLVKNLEEFYRHLDEAEQEEFRRSRHRGSASNGAVASSSKSFPTASSDPLMSGSSTRSQSSKASGPKAKRLRPLSSPAPHPTAPVKETNILRSGASSEEAAEKKPRGGGWSKIEAAQGSVTSGAASEVDSLPPGIKPHRLFARGTGDTSSVAPRISDKQFDHIWEDEANWDNCNSSSSGSSRRSAMQVAFEVKPPRHGSAASSSMQRHGSINRQIRRFLSERAAEVPWSHLRMSNDSTPVRRRTR